MSIKIRQLTKWDKSNNFTKTARQMQGTAKMGRMISLVNAGLSNILMCGGHFGHMYRYRRPLTNFNISIVGNLKCYKN